MGRKVVMMSMLMEEREGKEKRRKKGGEDDCENGEASLDLNGTFMFYNGHSHKLFPLSFIITL